MLTSVDALIDALGGTSKVADMAGVGLSAVSNWKARGRIPSEKFMIFDAALGSLNTRADPSLFGFEEARQ